MIFQAIFQAANGLVIDILVGIILACIKAVARIQDIKTQSGPHSQSNVFLEHKYDHWERTILWLEDISESKFSYLENQVQFLTTLIGIFYGIVICVLLLILNSATSLNLSNLQIAATCIVTGTAFGIAGGKSLTSRPQIFDIDSNKFKGDYFD